MTALRTGYFTASYVSLLDDTEQPFAVWVPRSYSPRKKYPLLVALHGTDADHRMIPEACFRIPERGFREDVILLCPFGRGDLGFRWMGEADLWDALQWVKTRYSVDARRQYLTGLSMGGFATWRLGCAYPEQWAAIAPVCGGGEVKLLPALKRVPVWCVHGSRDDLVPVEHSRRLIAELRRLKFRHRYDELPGWGHNAWDYLYAPGRTRDSLVDWLLGFRKALPASARPKPKRGAVFHDLFSERIILSYPARGLVPKETELLRAEVERLARFHFGDCVMRSGRLIVKSDAELAESDLAGANHLMVGRTDNHAWLRRADRKLTARHVRGVLRVQGQTFLGKTLVVATVQANPWNPARLLGVITYQQFHQMRGIMERWFDPVRALQAVNIYDTLQHRFILQAPNPDPLKTGLVPWQDDYGKTMIVPIANWKSGLC